MTLKCKQSHVAFTCISLTVKWYSACRQEEASTRQGELTAALEKVKELQAQAALSKEAALALSADTAAKSSKLEQTCAIDFVSKCALNACCNF